MDDSADGKVPVPAGVAGHAGHLGRDEDAVAGIVPSDGITHFNDLGSDLMPLNERGPWQPVPLDNIASADAAGVNLDHHLLRARLWHGGILQPDIPVVVPHRDFHFFLFT